MDQMQSPQSICIIAAMSGPNRVIGKDNMLPWMGKVRGELKHFRETTAGCTVIMGKNTYLSIGQPLPKRNNIVVSRTLEETEGIDVCKSIDAAIEKAQSYSVPIFIIGGASIYEQAINLADMMILSSIKEEYDGDTFFPAIKEDMWRLSKEIEHDDFRVITYKKKQ